MPAVMVPCILPDDPEIPLPEGLEDYGYKTADECSHEYCAEADYYRRLYGGRRQSYTRDDIEAMNADRELVLDETGGRGFEL